MISVLISWSRLAICIYLLLVLEFVDDMNDTEYCKLWSSCQGIKCILRMKQFTLTLTKVNRFLELLFSNINLSCITCDKQEKKEKKKHNPTVPLKMMKMTAPQELINTLIVP